MSKVAIRLYQDADLPAIMTLFRDTVRRVNIRDYSSEQVLAWAPEAMDADRWRRRLEDAWTAVAELAGQVVGFGNLEANGHIDFFYTHADFQGCGIGREVLTAIEAQARRTKLARLVTEASITARPFFEKFGFVVLEPQEVECRGQKFVNYRMEKQLIEQSR